MDARIKRIDSFFNLIVVGLAFLVPVFFLPITSEFYEFNKLILITVATLLMVILWIVKMLIAKKVEVIKSPLNIPIWLLVAVVVLSTIFSTHVISSVYGSFGRWFPSIFSLAVFVAFFYVVSCNASAKSTITKAVAFFIFGVTIASLVALFSYFGLFFTSRPEFALLSFNPTGSVITIAVLASLATVLALAQLAYAKSTPSKFVLAQTAIINLIVVALFGIGSYVSWIIFGLGVVALFMVVPLTNIKANKVFLTLVAGVGLAVAASLMLPSVKELVVNANFTQAPKLTTTQSWLVSSNSITEFPLLGTGPSTFYLNMSRYKPLSLNATDSWNLRFDKPSNELFNILGTVGIIGAVAFLYLFVSTVRLGLLASKHRTQDGARETLLIGIFVLLATFFLTYANIALVFTLALFVALLIMDLAQDNYVSKVQKVRLTLSSLGAESQKEVLQYLVSVPLAVFVILMGYYAYVLYSGEYNFRKSIVALANRNGLEAYDYQRKAIAQNPRMPRYHIAYAQTNLALAGALANREGASEADLPTIQTLISQAIRESRLATEALNPLDVINWEIRAQLGQALLGLAQDANNWTLSAYNNAIQLDPANPRLRLAIGGIYYNNQDYLTAANFFRQATNLKSDYANAHYNLAMALKNLQNYELAQRELELTKRLLPAESADIQRVDEELGAVATLLSEQQAQAQAKPTITDLEQPDVAGASTQGPLTEPGELEAAEGQEILPVTEEVVEELIEEDTPTVTEPETTPEE